MESVEVFGTNFLPMVGSNPVKEHLKSNRSNFTKTPKGFQNIYR